MLKPKKQANQKRMNTKPERRYKIGKENFRNFKAVEFRYKGMFSRYDNDSKLDESLKSSLENVDPWLQNKLEKESS